jgi:threonine dehydrogenase-like Zn-dependent dehydrogenase
VVLKSTHHGPTTLALSPLVVDEIRLIGSRCGRFDRAIALLKTGAVDVDDLVSAVFRIEDGVAAFGRAEDPGSMKVLMRIAEETETV